MCPVPLPENDVHCDYINKANERRKIRGKVMKCRSATDCNIEPYYLLYSTLTYLEGLFWPWLPAWRMVFIAISLIKEVKRYYKGSRGLQPSSLTGPTLTSPLFRFFPQIADQLPRTHLRAVICIGITNRCSRSGLTQVRAKPRYTSLNTTLVIKIRVNKDKKRPWIINGYVV